MSTARLTRTLGCLIIASAVACSAAQAGAAFHDSFNDNDVSDWDFGPAPWTDPNTVLYGRPAASDGRIWGIGSGYGNPTSAWMVRPLAFSSSSIAIQTMGRSGTGWPNSATICLFSAAWPRIGATCTGGLYDGQLIGAHFTDSYMFNVYGESNQRVELRRLRDTGAGSVEEFWIFRWNHDVTTDQTYRAERDATGHWSLWCGDAAGGNMQRVPDAELNAAPEDPSEMLTSFGHVGIEMLRHQSCLDYVMVESLDVDVDVDVDVATLAVCSTPVAGVAITGTRPGTTNYTAACTVGESATLTAPAGVAVERLSYCFARWLIDGAEVPERPRTITVTMDADHTATVQYDICPRTLTVRSFPALGVDIGGDRPGTTEYAAGCVDHEIVTLSAPSATTLDGRTWYFVYWLVHNSPRPRYLREIQVTVDADITATAVYDPNPPGDTNGDCVIDVLDLIFSRNRLGTKC